jgi:hypothetical protein
VFVPIIAFLIIGNIGGGFLLTKLRYWFPFYLIGTVCCLVGSVLLHMSRVDTSIPKICVFGILLALGSALYSQLGFTIIAGKVPPNRIGPAIGFLSIGQVFGASICVAVAANIMIGSASSKLEEILPNTPVSVLKDLMGGTADSSLNALPAVTRAAVIEAIVEGIDKAYILGIVAAVIGIICTLCLPHEKIAAKKRASGVCSIKICLILDGGASR